MSDSHNNVTTTNNEFNVSSCNDSLEPDPVDMRIKMEEVLEENTTPVDPAILNQPPLPEDPNNTGPPSIALADGTLVCEPSELQILHALDQKINRLERMTVGIFEIIRHLGVQVHGVSNHLTNIDNKMQKLIQENPGNDGNVNTTHFGQQPPIQVGIFDQSEAPAMSSLAMSQHHQPPISMSEVASIPTECSTRRLSWNERFEELKRYKETNGHCDVPQIFDTGLGTWVSAQRSQFKRYIVGKTSSMTHQRKAALDKLGFSWSLRKRFSWDERFAELKEYSETHNGSCDVPNEGDYKPLWTWCQNQKQAYKRGREGKSHPVPVERITLMEQIGFRWSTSSAAAAAAAENCASYYPSLSTPSEGSNSPLSDSDGICSEIGEL